MIRLTGARTKAGQIKNLRDNQVYFTVRADGWPVTSFDAWHAVRSTTHVVHSAETPRFDLL